MKSPWLLMLLAVFFFCGCGDQSKPPKKMMEQRPMHVPCDDFNLPLVIQIDVPEAPLEIQKPSGPIVEKTTLPQRARFALNETNFLFWTQLLAVTEWVIRLTMLPVIVLRKEKPTTCLAWLTIVFFEPWIGLGLYLLVGENRLGRRRLARRRSRRSQIEASEYPPVESHHIIDPHESDDYNVLVHLAERVGGLPVVAGNAISPMTNTEVVIERLIADIDEARQHVHLLFYIFKDDTVGRRVAEALGRAVERGVVCRVLADAVGSRQLFKRLAPSLRQQGVRIFPVLPATLWRLPFARLDLRNHRKLAVIDGSIAYTGSQNIVEASYGHKRAGVWHDIMARITGPVVRQLQGIFLEDWFYESGELLEDAALFPANPAEGPIAVQVIPTGPDQPTELFQDLIVKSIFMARRRVVITSPLLYSQRGDASGDAHGGIAGRAGRSGDSPALRPSGGPGRRQLLLRLSDAFRCERLSFHRGHAPRENADGRQRTGHVRLGQLRHPLVRLELRAEPVRPCRRGGRRDAAIAAGLSRTIGTSHLRPVAQPNPFEPLENEPGQTVQPAVVKIKG